MGTFVSIFTAIFLFSMSAVAGPLKVVTSTTDLAWATKEIGGNLVEVSSLLKGHENPHFVDAVPDFIRRVAEAQMVCVIGLDLEIGWMPKVLSRSGNAQVQPGGKGYCETGKAIAVLEKPAGAVNRSMGDVHPSGNPHYWLSPKAFAQGATVIAETLTNLDPANAAAYQNGLKRFTEQMDQLVKKGNAKLHPILARTSAPIMEYHKEFAYFLETYGLKSFGSVEEKPGVPPSAGRLLEIATGARAAGVRFVIAGDTAPKKVLEKFKELSSIPVVVVPLSLQTDGATKTYPEFQELLVGKIAEELSHVPGV